MSLINTIACGDCREILPTLPAKSFQLAFADPPYWVNFEYNGIKDSEMAYIEPEFLVNELLRIAEIVCITPGITHMFDYPKPSWVGAWYKADGATMNGKGGVNKWDPIFLYNISSLRSDVFVANVNWSQNKGRFHKCPKPELLLRKLILEFTQVGDSVIDPVSGSGTTCAAAKMLERNYFGIEIDPNIVELSLKRLSESQPPLLGMAQANTASSRLFEGWGDLPAVANQSESDLPA